MTKPPTRHKSSRIMRSRQRLAARAAESNWILQGIKNDTVRSCWSSCSAFVLPIDLVTTRCFLKTLEDIARWIFQSQLEEPPLVHRLLLWFCRLRGRVCGV